MRYAASLLLASLAGAAMAAPINVEGPVTITASNAEWVNGVGVYTGNVLMQSKTLDLKGDRLEFAQPGGKSSAFVITLTGKPATLNHAGTGKQDPDVSAEASTVVYRSGTQDVQLSGNARLTRGTDVLTGETVTYNTAARSVKANGGSGKQVKIVIDVPQNTGSGKP